MMQTVHNTIFIYSAWYTVVEIKRKEVRKCTQKIHGKSIRTISMKSWNIMKVIKIIFQKTKQNVLVLKTLFV